MEEVLNLLKEWLEGGVAFYAAVVATGALALEIRRWRESGVRLALSVMPEAQMTGRGMSKKDEEKLWLMLTVVNRGETPTTLTHFVIHWYDGWLAFIRRKPTWGGLVLDPAMPGTGSGQLPYWLESGRS